MIRRREADADQRPHRRAPAPRHPAAARRRPRAAHPDRLQRTRRPAHLPGIVRLPARPRRERAAGTGPAIPTRPTACSGSACTGSRSPSSPCCAAWPPSWPPTTEPPNSNACLDILLTGLPAAVDPLPRNSEPRHSASGRPRRWLRGVASSGASPGLLTTGNRVRSKQPSISQCREAAAGACAEQPAWASRCAQARSAAKIRSAATRSPVPSRGLCSKFADTGLPVTPRLPPWPGQLWPG